MWLRLNPVKDALFLDVDGTLLDIAKTAQDVVVPPRLIKDLERLQKKLGGALAFLSGRKIEDIDRLFTPLRLPCSGVHGAEWRLSPEGPIKTAESLPRDLRSAALSAFVSTKGVHVEDKEFSLAFHYRQAPDMKEKIEKKVLALIKQFLPDGIFISGRKVIEITRPLHTKGQALEKLLAAPLFRNRRPVFLGDDITDLSAIGACLKMGGVAARVGKGKPRLNAFASPESVREWINRMIIEVS